MPRTESNRIEKRGAPDANLSSAPGIREILRQPDAWWSALGLFGSDYFWYFLVTWLPAYLEKERHFPKEKMAVFGSLSYLAAALTSLFAGWIADRLIARGGSATGVRKSFAGLGLACATIILPVAVVRDERASMTFLILACIAFGAYSSTTFAITQTLAGPRAAGKWTAFQNGVGNLAGVAAPWFTGWIVERTGEFYLAFVAAAAAALLGAAVFVWGIGRIEPVRYREAVVHVPA
jgi:cyanate permease